VPDPLRPRIIVGVDILDHVPVGPPGRSVTYVGRVTRSTLRALPAPHCPRRTLRRRHPGAPDRGGSAGMIRRIRIAKDGAARPGGQAMIRVQTIIVNAPPNRGRIGTTWRRATHREPR
jgi:hypothetical protein